MALTLQKNFDGINISTVRTLFNETYSANDDANYSGIYKCSKCGREIAHNKDDNPLPPHYPNKDCRAPSWQLFILAEN